MVQCTRKGGKGERVPRKGIRLRERERERERERKKKWHWFRRSEEVVLGNFIYKVKKL